MHSLSPAQEQQIIALYKRGHSYRKVSRQTGVPDSTVRSCLIRNGVPLRRHRDACRRYKVNTRAFKRRKNGASYWIGFLMADGAINNDRTLTVTLQRQDRHHIEKFRAFLRSEHPIRDIDAAVVYKGRPSVRRHTRIVITSKDIVESLALYGVVPKKSHSARASDPRALRDRRKALAMNRHFWRGVIDGNGTIGVQGGQPYVGLCGSASLLQQFLTFARSIYPTKATVRPHASIFRIRFVGRPALALLRRLYAAPLAYSLDRKRLTARSLLKAAADKEK